LTGLQPDLPLNACISGWFNRDPQVAIDYQREAIRVLNENHGKRPRFSDAQRRQFENQGNTGDIKCRERLG